MQREKRRRAEMLQRFDLLDHGICPCMGQVLDGGQLLISHKEEADFHPPSRRWEGFRSYLIPNTV